MRPVVSGRLRFEVWLQEVENLCERALRLFIERGRVTGRRGLSGPICLEHAAQTQNVLHRGQPIGLDFIDQDRRLAEYVDGLTLAGAPDLSPRLDGLEAEQSMLAGSSVLAPFTCARASDIVAPLATNARVTCLRDAWRAPASSEGRDLVQVSESGRGLGEWRQAASRWREPTCASATAAPHPGTFVSVVPRRCPSS